MQNTLESELLSIETEAVGSAEPEDVTDAAGDWTFGRFAREILGVYQRRFPGISAGWVSVAGLVPGSLEPIASVPDGLKEDLPNLGKKEALDLDAESVTEIDGKTIHPYLRSAVPPSTKHVLSIRLVGHQEYYGVLILCSRLDRYFTGETLNGIRASLPLLNRLMAEENFSMRLKRLAAPFDFIGSTVSKEAMYREIVRQACRGFAADGAVLRVRKAPDPDPSGYSLEVEDQDGLVSEEQLSQSAAGHRICRSVLESSSGVTVQTLRPDGSRCSYGVAISDADDAQLRQFGVHAYMIMRLQSDLIDDPTSAMGTLSIFHRFPQVFSRRDISLFRSFCERVADDLALLEQRDANEAVSRFLQAQNALGTRAEIIALLGHDFGHRVFHVKDGLETLVETCRRNWKDRKLPDNVRTSAETLEKACNELASIVTQIRLLGQGADEPPKTFEVAEVFAEIKQRLILVFDRNNMDLEARTEGNCSLHGVRGILLQALFNLVVNAVDAHRAQREFGRKKLNTVHLQCREVGKGLQRRLEFSIWDDGPGISRTAFPDAQEIFEVGRTSKPPGQGTGIGLPAARNLIGRYFHADLQLTDRTKALFQFSVPAPPTEK